MEEFPDGYYSRIEEFVVKYRSVLDDLKISTFPLTAKGFKSGDLKNIDFPSDLLLEIKDLKEFNGAKKQSLMAYVIGSWFLENVSGHWCFAPMMNENPEIYFKFGIGVAFCDGKNIVNVSGISSDVMQGEDIEFIGELLKSNVKLANDCK
ncbi:hypothetical protein Clow_01501 [Corynebacterium lowii]|uniref:Uncharacterized protein n=2 Tax=Corynebacterium lowii TaxID=1544413 RepID=A0A0Q0U2P3_9CORY|nr:hypothetical protein Clow_01501 [Corynebacterium lowii]